MEAVWKRVLVGIGVLSCGALAEASDVTIHLTGSQSILRNTVKVQCDIQGSEMGLPAGVFSVEYLNGAGNSLAVVSVGGNSLIFANRDAAGRGITFPSHALGGTMSSACHRVQ
jgi:membrane-bound inhibitor of C-type lysozyme